MAVSDRAHKGIYEDLSGPAIKTALQKTQNHALAIFTQYKLNYYISKQKKSKMCVFFLVFYDIKQIKLENTKPTNS